MVLRYLFSALSVGHSMDFAMGQYDIIPIDSRFIRSAFYSLMAGGDTMTVYESISLMIAFATLVVLIITSCRK